MIFVKHYFKMINYILMGLVFAFASFYLLLNAYHFLEIRKDFVTDFNSQQLVIEIEDKMNKVSSNISNFNVNNYHGSVPNNRMAIIQNQLKNCITNIKNSTYEEMKTKNKITIVDVYQLREAYEDKVLSKCIVNGLYWTTTLDDTFGSNYLVNNKELSQLYINSLLSDTVYLKKDLINNSSYYFNTAITSASIKDNTRDGFYEVMGAYNRAASFVEYVSNWFHNEMEGNYD